MITTNQLKIHTMSKASEETGKTANAAKVNDNKGKAAPEKKGKGWLVLPACFVILGAIILILGINVHKANDKVTAITKVAENVADSLQAKLEADSIKAANEIVGLNTALTAANNQLVEANKKVEELNSTLTATKAEKEAAVKKVEEIEAKVALLETTISQLQVQLLTGNKKSTASGTGTPEVVKGNQAQYGKLVVDDAGNYLVFASEYAKMKEYVPKGCEVVVKNR
jgi:hypothetical protein